MTNRPAPARLADLARVVGKTRPEDHVWHFVLHRAGQPASRGERLGTLALAPADVARYGAQDMLRAGLVPGPVADQEAVGLRVLARALEAERREWVRRAIAAGFADGWSVSLVAERGYRRSVFPGAAVAGLATPKLLTPAGGSST